MSIELKVFYLDSTGFIHLQVMSMEFAPFIMITPKGFARVARVSTLEGIFPLYDLLSGHQSVRSHKNVKNKSTKIYLVTSHTL